MTASTNATQGLACLYRALGLALCRPDPGEKKPTYPGWPTRSLEPGDFTEGDLIGVIAGPLSDGNRPGHALVILDVDEPGALADADEFLPATGLEEGRPGKERDHRYYLVPLDSIPPWARSTAEQAAAAAVAQKGHPGPFLKHFSHARTKARVLDFLGTGGQAVCPSGPANARRWAGGAPGAPSVVPFEDLWDAAGQLALARGCAPGARGQANGDRPYGARQVHPDLLRRVLAYLATCDPAVSGAGGHDDTYWPARAVCYGFDLGEELGFQVLWEHFNPRCVPPWTEKELRHKCHDADTRPFGKPRGWLRDDPGDRRQGYTATGTNGQQQAPPPDWEELVPLDRLAPPSPFPLETLPEPLAEYVCDCARATGSPVDFVAVPVLALAAGCIGASRCVGVTRNHVQPATLYAVVIGMPGSGKSPALEATLEPLEEAERRYHRQWLEDLRAWKEEDPESRGRKPTLRRVVVDDTTSEALMRTLHANQRGVIMVRDELSALVAGFNQYKANGKGADRQTYLKAWSAATIRVDRKSNEDELPLVIRRPSLSIIGGVQPDVIRAFLASDEEGRAMDDGLLDRFLFSYPRDLPATGERFAVIEESGAALWGRVVSWLLSLDQWRSETGLRPKIVKLTEEGKAAWVEFTEGHAAELNREDFPDYRRGPWAKLRGYCARLALVLQFIHLAVNDPQGWGDDVDGLAVQGAARLIEYFKAHYLRVAARMGADPRQAKAQMILAWLRRNPDLAVFSRRDCYRTLTASFAAPADLESPLALLVQHGYLRREEAGRAKNGAGRLPTPRWEVNPLWDRKA